MSCIPTLIFSLTALVLSYITARHTVNAYENRRTDKKADREELWRDYIFNFLGCALGWFSAYYLIFQRFGQTLGPTDLVLIFVAYIGITGYLPYIIINKSFKL